VHPHVCDHIYTSGNQLFDLLPLRRCGLLGEALHFIRSTCGGVVSEHDTEMVSERVGGGSGAIAGQLLVRTLDWVVFGAAGPQSGALGAAMGAQPQAASLVMEMCCGRQVRLSLGSGKPDRTVLMTCIL
jgi:hypothetical protein